MPPCPLESAEERTARHLRVCAELVDLGMDLARRAAARARTGLTDPEEQLAAPDPATLAPADAPSEPAPVATLRRAAGTCLRAPACNAVDPALLFIRLAAAVRACVALEARLAGDHQTTPRAAAPSRHADPRRACLLDGFRLVTKNHPDRIDLLRETTTRLDEELAADLDQKAEISELFFTICDAVGIEIDLAKLPDIYLGILPDDPAYNIQHNAPSPRAPSPP
jgi:hypothetical protein